MSIRRPFIISAGLVAAALLAMLPAASAVQAASLNAVSATGHGSITDAGTANCQNSPGYCIVTSEGILKSQRLGKGTFNTTLTVLWSAATPNGHLDGTGTPDGYCAPANGSSTLTAANNDEIDVSIEGTVCEVGATGSGVPHTFNGTYFVTGGTGKFKSATGSGNVVSSDDGNGGVLTNLSGDLMR